MITINAKMRGVFYKMGIAKVITAAEAAALIEDGATIASAPFALAGWPEEVALAIEKRFLETGHPRDLTHVHAAGVGNRLERGESAWTAHEGLIKRLILSHTDFQQKTMDLIEQNKVEAYNLPLGVILQLYNEIARRGPGLLTKVGMGTFIDPRFDGGKLNTKAQEDLVELVNFAGEEWLFYKKFPVNVTIIRGTSADEKGNITFEKEGVSLEWLPVAQAAKACGGITIVQVERIVKSGTMHPKLVKVPGIYVDYIVVASKPEYQQQTAKTFFNAAFAGDIKVPTGSIPPIPLDGEKVMCRRSAMELKPGAIALGIGIPQAIANVLSEEKADHLITPISESGSIGGIPGVGGDFGHHFNAEASVDQHAHFNYYDGGGLETAFIGLGECDIEGNINASKFNGKVYGVGGFINVTQNAKKVIFTGNFTAGKLKVKVEDGKLVIEQEGKFRKFLNKIVQTTFSGKYANEVGQTVMFITDRAVLELTPAGLVLTEIAPGIDLEKDVLAQMEFKPIISPNLKLMPAEIFQPTWGKLKQIIETNN